MKPVQTAVSYLGQSSDYVTAPCDGTNLGIDPHVQPNPPPLLNCTKTYQPTYQYHAFPPFIGICGGRASYYNQLSRYLVSDNRPEPVKSVQLICADDKADDLRILGP